MSEFDGEPLQVVAKRTSSAHRDFADWRVSSERQDEIARNLKLVPWSEADKRHGEVRLRSFGDGFEVAFLLLSQDDEFIVLVIGYDREGEMEEGLAHLKRAALEGLHPSIKALVEGRKRKSEL
ncbi:hypothetical protein [Roseibium polysiphoniae]|uniref:hypothetical protein n=1 Tax=Roseibium polysiphoniae TaxID=2571221 RepID=UPI0032985945